MKFVSFVKKHCFLVVALVILLIVLIVGIILAKTLFFSNGGDVFGNRLDGIEEHQVSDSDLKKIKDELKSMDTINKVDTNVVGRRIDFIIEVKADVDDITAKGYADQILEKLPDDVKEFYDIQAMITNEDAENQNYPMLGYKHKSKAGFTF